LLKNFRIYKQNGRDKPMNTPDVMEQSIGPLETQLQNTAQTFNYPPTPNLSAGVRQQLAVRRAQRIFPTRRLAWAMMLVVLGLGILMAASPVRTTVVEVLRQGAIRVFLLEPLPNSTPLLTMTPGPAVSAEAPRLASPQSLLTTPYPSATPISARNGEKLTAPAAPTTQVTLPARLPLKPDSSF
jgi:hypothetical protein